MSKPLHRRLLALAILAGAQVPAVAFAQVGWKSGNFGPPNGGHLVYRVTTGNNPACASYNGRDCLWGQTIRQIDFRRVRPLVCGNPHKAVWGSTGYENRRHWCVLARSSDAGF